MNKIENDSAVFITPNQLKETNLIFVEHQKLLIENNLLLEQISNFKYDNSLLQAADSIKFLQIENYKELISTYDLEIEELNKELKNKNASLLMWKVGGVAISAGLLIWLLLK